LRTRTPAAVSIHYAAALVSGLAAAACLGCGASDQRDTSQEYFESINSDPEIETRSADLFAAFQEAETGVSEEERAQLLVAYYKDLSPLLGEVVERLESVEPPEDLAQMHERFASAWAGYKSGLDDAIVRLGDAPAPSEITFVIVQTATPAQLHLEDVCDEMKRLGNEEGVELDCGPVLH
jgi:hypothetical protein